MSDDQTQRADGEEGFPGYEILGLLGQGGMGRVFKARHTALDRIVAIKILNEDLSGDAMFVQRFEREARAMARLTHPHIVTVHDFGIHNGQLFLIMEFIDGVDLSDMIKTNSLSPEQALRIVGPICDALQYAHDQGVIHRDIKPANILVDKQGGVRVTDFGIAKLLSDPGQSDHEMTITRHIMGTPDYMSPEQRRDTAHVDHRADIYSLGVMFYEMLTGDRPQGHFLPPSQRISVDVRLDDVVLKAMAQDPERRYSRVADMKTEITSITDHDPERTILTPPAPPPPVKADSSRKSPVLVLMIFLMLLAAAGWYAYQSGWISAFSDTIRGSEFADADPVPESTHETVTVAFAPAPEALPTPTPKAERSTEPVATVADPDAAKQAEASVKAQQELLELQRKVADEGAVIPAQQLAEAEELKQLRKDVAREKERVEQQRLAALAEEEKRKRKAEVEAKAKEQLRAERKLAAERDAAEQERLALQLLADQKTAAEEKIKAEAQAAAAAKARQPVEGQDWVSPVTGMPFVWIPQLNLWVGKYEVTNAEYRLMDPQHDSKNFHGHSLNEEGQPVVELDFEGTVQFAEWITSQDRKTESLPEGFIYRLPDEEEWQTYAHCGQQADFAWGNTWPPQSGKAGNFWDQTAADAIGGSGVEGGYTDGFIVSAEVQKCKPNPWGLHGVTGNVWECCAGDKMNPVFGAWRGASWGSLYDYHLKLSYRSVNFGSTRGDDRGFRLLLAPVLQQKAKP